MTKAFIVLVWLGMGLAIHAETLREAECDPEWSPEPVVFIIAYAGAPALYPLMLANGKTVCDK